MLLHPDRRHPDAAARRAGFSTPQLGYNSSLSPYDGLIEKESEAAHA